MADMDDLLRQAQAMQQALVSAQAEAAEAVVVGRAGGGLVEVAITGDLDVRSVTIDPQAVDPDEVELLEDLVVAAVRDALGQAAELRRQAIGQVGLGGLGGLLG